LRKEHKFPVDISRRESIETMTEDETCISLFVVHHVTSEGKFEETKERKFKIKQCMQRKE
jgi:hypothetical protein